MFFHSQRVQYPGVGPGLAWRLPRRGCRGSGPDYYYYPHGESQAPGATGAQSGASVRYWVEDWAKAHGLPELVTGSRDANGDVDFSLIDAMVATNLAYPGDPGSANRFPGPEFSPHQPITRNIR